MSSASLDWIWWVVGGLLGVTGVAMLVWALLVDRARGRRRCPRCWYDLSGSDALTCSACGKTARSERRLRKTRRRWRWAALALLLAVGGLALTATPKVRRGGWLALVPPEGLVHAGGPAGNHTAYHPRNMEVHGDRARLRRADFRDGTWSFHVRGDPAMALWLDGPRRNWSGSFTVPALLVDRAKDFGPNAQPWPPPVD